MSLTSILSWSVGAPILITTALGAAAIVFGGPREPEPMTTINQPFRGLDMSALPPPVHVPGPRRQRPRLPQVHTTGSTA
jgi:hypothetical protein